MLPRSQNERNTSDFNKTLCSFGGKLQNVLFLTNCVPEARAELANPRLMIPAVKLNLPDTRDAAPGLLHLLLAVFLPREAKV